MLKKSKVTVYSFTRISKYVDRFTNLNSVSSFWPILKVNTSLSGSDISVTFIPSGRVVTGGMTLIFWLALAPQPLILKEKGLSGSSPGVRDSTCLSTQGGPRARPCARQSHGSFRLVAPRVQPQLGYLSCRGAAHVHSGSGGLHTGKPQGGVIEKPHGVGYCKVGRR